jgi:hypothetical protein
LDPALTDGITDDPIVILEAPHTWRVDVSIRDRETSEQWFVPARVEVASAEEVLPDGDVRIRIAARVVARVDPMRLAGGRSLHPGMWLLRVRLTGAGLDREAQVAGPGAGAGRGAVPAILGGEPQVVIPVLDSQGLLLIDVGRRSTTLGEALADRPVVPLLADGRTIEARLAAVTSRPRTSGIELTVRAPASDRRLAANLEERRGRLVVVGRVRGERLPEGRHPLLVHLDGADGPSLSLGDLDVDGGGRIHLAGASHVGPLEALVRRLGARLRPGAQVLRLGRRMPAPVKRTVRRVRRSISGWKRR